MTRSITILENKEHTEGVKTLLGDPKKAIIKLSIPMVAAMSAQTIYNLTDAIWVSGKGPEALSAVGFIFPFLFMVMAIANGIGIGGGSAISRMIGAKNKESTDLIASHTIIIMLIFAAFLTLTMLFLARPVLHLMGAGAALGLSVIYARIMFSGIVFIFFVDPIFIYSFDLGVAGAAWATILSMALVSIACFYWLFLEKKTYVSFKFKGFSFSKDVIGDIGRVGFPASVSQMSMSLMAAALITIVASVGGPDGVAVYTTGWRVISLATLPILGVASAVTSVTGAAFGNRDYNNIKISYLYALKTCVLVECILALVVFIFAKQITWIFTWSKESARIINDLTLFLKILCLILPTVAFGMLSSAMFQGVGQGFNALIMTLVRTFVFTIPFAWFFGIYLNRGLRGIWIGMVAAGIAYIPIVFGWAISHIWKDSSQNDASILVERKFGK